MNAIYNHVCLVVVAVVLSNIAGTEARGGDGVEQIIAYNKLDAFSGRASFIIERHEGVKSTLTDETIGRDALSPTARLPSRSEYQQAFWASDWDADVWRVLEAEYAFQNELQYKKERPIELNQAYIDRQMEKSPVAHLLDLKKFENQSTMIYNNNSTIVINVPSDMLHAKAGDERMTVTVTDPIKLYIPRFWRFGRVQKYLPEAPDRNRISLETVNELIVLRYKGEQVEVRLTLDENKDFAVLGAKLFVSNDLVREDRYSSYTQTSSGYWYPTVSEFISYMPVEGDDAQVVRHEVYRASSGVELNVELNKELFFPEFPSEARVYDER